MVELCLFFCLQDDGQWMTMHTVTLSVGLLINNMANLLFSR